MMSKKSYRLVLSWFATVSLTVLQAVAALRDQLDNVSSSSLRGGLESDLLLLAFPLGFVLTGLLLLINKTGCPQTAGIFFCILVLSGSWITINALLFDDYEASRSTYTKKQLWTTGVLLSLRPICVMFLARRLVPVFILKNKTFIFL